MDNKSKKTLSLAFNPSSRSTLKEEDFDYIQDILDKSAIKIIEKEDREMFTILMTLIYIKLKEDPSFGEILCQHLDTHLLSPSGKKLISKITKDPINNRVKILWHHTCR